MANKKKKILRSEMKKVLTHLDERWIVAASREICESVFQILIRNENPIEHVLAWQAFFQGEVHLERFIDKALENFKVYLPRVSEDGTMSFFSVDKTWRDSLTSGTSGLLEPDMANGELYSFQNVASTAVLVPGLAFTRNGERIGRGKGCYDRFLGKNGMIEAVKIGTCFNLQLVDTVPTESYDIAMDWLVHEEGTVKCHAKI